jgi:hypothetical protein
MRIQTVIIVIISLLCLNCSNVNDSKSSQQSKSNEQNSNKNSKLPKSSSSRQAVADYVKQIIDPKVTIEGYSLTYSNLDMTVIGADCLMGSDNVTFNFIVRQFSNDSTPPTTYWRAELINDDEFFQIVGGNKSHKLNDNKNSANDD